MFIATNAEHGAYNLVAGATGNLGMRIVKALCSQHAEVRVVVRAGSKSEILKSLAQHDRCAISARYFG